MKKSSLIMTCVIIFTILVVCLSGCSDEKNDETTAVYDATVAVEAILNDNNVEYESVVAEKRDDLPTEYSCYSFIIILDVNDEGNYKTMFDTLKLLEGTKYYRTLLARDWKEPKCVVVGTIEEGRFAKMTEQHRRVYSEEGLAPTLTTCAGGNTEPKVMIGAMRGRNPENPSSRKPGIATEQRLEIGGEIANALTTVQKDNLVIEPQVLVPRRTEFGKEIRKDYENGTVKMSRHEMTEMEPRNDGMANTITTVQKDNLVAYVSGQNDGVRVRKLTPRECYRLMGWTDNQIDKIIKAGISKTQQYKQAGNGIVVQVLEALFRQLFMEG